jgi:hypothetical protein
MSKNNLEAETDEIKDVCLKDLEHFIWTNESEYQTDDSSDVTETLNLLVANALPKLNPDNVKIVLEDPEPCESPLCEDTITANVLMLNIVESD